MKVVLEKGGNSIAISYVNGKTVSLQVKSHGKQICAVLNEILKFYAPLHPNTNNKKVPDPNYQYTITGHPTTPAGMYNKAADLGSDIAQNMCGVMYENGEGVSCSQATAQEWFRKAAAQCHAQAKEKVK